MPACVCSQVSAPDPAGDSALQTSYLDLGDRFGAQGREEDGEKGEREANEAGKEEEKRGDGRGGEGRGMNGWRGAELCSSKNSLEKASAV